MRGPNGELPLEDRWMFSRLTRIAGEMAAAWDAFRFHEAAHLIYHFFWHEFCDWYLELKKLSFDAGSDKSEEQRQAGMRVPPAFENLCRAFDIALRLLHPMMPFITEELWQRLGERRSSIALAPFPAHDPSLVDEEAERQMGVLQSIIVGIRNARSQWGVDAGRKIPVILVVSEDLLGFATRYQQVIERLAHVTLVPTMATTGDILLGQSGYRIEPPEEVDHAAEKARLEKQEQKLSREISTLQAQLENKQFLSRASAQIVAERRRRMEEVVAEHEKVRAELRELG